MRRMMLVVLFVLLAAVSFADVPHIISYQGRLTDTKSGEPMTGEHDITFKLYTSESGFDRVWSEMHSAVFLNNGLFNVMLGSVAPLDIDFSEQYWLEVIVDGVAMEPRYKLGASPYALGIADDAVTSEKIRTGAVTNSALANDVVFAEIYDGAFDRQFALTNRIPHLQFVGGSGAEVEFDEENHRITIDVPVETDLRKSDTEWTSGAGTVYLTDSGDDVGIGTSSPNAKLDVRGTAIFNDGSGDYDFRVEGNGDSHLFFTDAGSDEVGIGTSAPAGKLDVKDSGTTGDRNIICATNSNWDALILQFDEDVADNHWRWRCSGAAVRDIAWAMYSTERMRLTTDGKLGIGTSAPGQLLDVRGGAIFNEASGDYDFRIESNGDANIFFVDGGNDKIGIGTNTPAAKLTVHDGAILADGTTGSTPTSGAGTRMMWIPEKRAFRAGYVHTGGSTWWDNANIGNYSFAVGENSKASGSNATVCGGRLNEATGTGSAVAGGTENEASATGSFVGGGGDNTSTGGYSTIAGGEHNDASGDFSAIGGGQANLASGDYSTVPGGIYDTASAAYSFATNSGSTADETNSAAFNGMDTDTINQLKCDVLECALASATVKSFRIDYPLDPSSSNLRHYCIESPELLTFYRGVAYIGDDSTAEILLPDYFDTLNINPMIQLTGVGSPNVYIADDITGNRFIIGGEPGTKVYWQVTGERNDQSAQIARIVYPVIAPKSSHYLEMPIDDEFLIYTYDMLVEHGYEGLFDFKTDYAREKYESLHSALADTTE